MPDPTNGLGLPEIDWDALNKSLTPQPAAPTAPAMPKVQSGYSNGLSNIMAPRPQPTGARGFIHDVAGGLIGPQAAGEIDQQALAKQTQQGQQALSLLMEQRALPQDQRHDWTMQMAPQLKAVGADPSLATPDEFTDQALDGHIAQLAGMLKISPADLQKMRGGPEPMSAYQQAQIGIERDKLNAPKSPQYFSTADGVVEAGPGGARLAYGVKPKPDPAMTPYQEESLKIQRERLARDGGGAGGKFRRYTAEEVAAAGYPAGTVVQVDDRGQEHVTSRPTTQQTGQPTESERKFALEASTSGKALKILDDLEAKGYDRGAEMNPFSDNGRKYDQALDQFLDGWARAMTGAAMSKEEKQYYYDMMRPRLGDGLEVRQQKAASRAGMYNDLRNASGRAVGNVDQSVNLAAQGGQPQGAPQPVPQTNIPKGGILQGMAQQHVMDTPPPQQASAPAAPRQPAADPRLSRLSPEDRQLFQYMTPQEQQQFLAAH